MLNRIAELSLTENIDADQIYYLFKTDDSEKNLQILSKLRKFTTVTDLFNYYISYDASLINKSLKLFGEQLFQIFEKKNYTTHFSNNEIESYISDVSKIILPLNIIIQIEKNLNDILLGLKEYLSKLHTNNIIKNKANEQFTNCINKLFCKNNYSLYPKAFSRTSTKENTEAARSISDLNDKKEKIIFPNNFNTVKKKNSDMSFKRRSIINEEILDDLETPKFDGETTNKNQNNSNNEIEVSRLKTKDSELSLTRLVFISPEKYHKKSTHIKQKNTTKENNLLIMKALKRKMESKDNVALEVRRSSKNICLDLIEDDGLAAKKLPGEYIHKRIRSRSDCLNPKNETDVDKTKIYMELIESINELYKKTKINAEEKILLKKIITNPNQLHNIYREAFVKGNDIGKDINIRNKLMNRLLIILENIKEGNK